MKEMEKGEIGTTSSDLIDALPAAWKKLTETKGRFTKERNWSELGYDPHEFTVYIQ